jgi:energy-coupling factor transporter ATP-binding protein EcfA2
VTVQDEIFAWVQGLDLWKQELFKRASASPTLPAADTQEVIAMLLGGSDGNSFPREVTRGDLPGAEGGDEPMLVKSLSDLRAVNKIQDGQKIGFEEGLKVVYGGNGAGKTGYSRVLKHAGRTLRPESVLANVASPSSEAPSATVNIVVGGKLQAVQLDLEQPGPAMLGRICIADADADDRYLTSETEIDYVPASLASVSRLADGLKAIDTELKEMLADAEPPELDLRPYTEGTGVFHLLNGLEAKTPDDLIVALSTLNEAERKQREQLRKQRAAMEASEAPKLRATAQREADSAEALKADLADVAGQLNQLSIEELQARRTGVHELTETAELAAKEFASEPLGGVGTEPWRILWQTAVDFAAHLEQSLPPDREPGQCPLCMQDLEPDARERLQRFDRFVRNDLNSKLRRAEDELAQGLDALPEIETKFARHQEAIDRLGSEPGETGALVRAWLASAEKLVAGLRNADRNVAAGIDPPSEKIDEWIAARHKEVGEYAALEDADEAKRVRSELAELDDRRLLGERREEILDRLAAVRRVEKLEAARKKLDKAGASRKVTELSRELIQANLQGALNRQLEALGFKGLEIEAKSKSPGGTPKISLRFKTVDDVPLKSVLSKGEQRRLALAMFLAEMEVISDPSPVIFDDPVSSIDQEGRRHIARTLLRLAEQRQVIVFTHELSFVYELDRLAPVGREAHVQQLRREGQTVGHVHPDLPWQGLSAKQRPKALYEMLAGATELDAAGNETEYEVAAAEFCRHLREAFERTVEECVLNDVVTRRHDTIRISRLRTIAWSEEICDLVDRGTDESSPWMHDRPRADGSEPPTPTELREGLEIFEALLKAIKEHRRSGEPADPPKAKLKAVKENADASSPPLQLEVVDSPGSEDRASH